MPLEYLLDIIFYTLFITGIILFFLPVIIPYYKKKKFIRRYQKRYLDNRKKSSRISLIIETAYTGEYGKEKFILTQLFCLLVLYIIGNKIGLNIFEMFFGAVFVTLIPVLFLYCIIHTKQVDSSNEGEKLILELLSQYLICNSNVIEALERCSIKTDNKFLKSALHKLTYKLKDYSTSKELLEGIREFSFKIGTKWSEMIGNSIYVAVVYGEDITASLQDILEEIRQIKRIIEKDKQLNNETFVIVKYVLPISYLLSIFTIIKYMNFPLNKFFAYQFGTNLGLKCFVAICFLTLANYLIFKIISRPKYDI